MRRVIFNKKGGVGKSSIACNLAAISARHGYKTLVIDLDVQGNSTHYLMGEPATALQNNVSDFFKQTISVLAFPKNPIEFIHPTPFKNLYIMPSSPYLEFMERELETRQKIYKLKNALEYLSQRFERIYIDTPPCLNFYSRSALIAAQRVLIPFDCDNFARQALYSLMDSITEIQDDHNPELLVEGIIANQYQANAKLPRKLVGELLDEGLPVLEDTISASVKMKESHELCTPLVYLAPKHSLTKQFVHLLYSLEAHYQPTPVKAASRKKPIAEINYEDTYRETDVDASRDQVEEERFHDDYTGQLLDEYDEQYEYHNEYEKQFEEF